jgi:hypothetical protein
MVIEGVALELDEVPLIILKLIDVSFNLINTGSD